MTQECTTLTPARLDRPRCPTCGAPAVGLLCEALSMVRAPIAVEDDGGWHGLEDEVSPDGLTTILVEPVLTDGAVTVYCPAEHGWQSETGRV